MKLLPRLPELPGQSDLTPAERNELWRRISRENPLLLFWLVLSMAVSYEVALASANGSFEIYRHFGGAGMILFMTAALGFWMLVVSTVAMRFVYLPQLEKAVARVRR